MTGLLVVLLLVAVIVLWASLSSLSQRVERLSALLIDVTDRTNTLASELLRLKSGHEGSKPGFAPPAAPPIVAAKAPAESAPGFAPPTPPPAAIATPAVQATASSIEAAAAPPVMAPPAASVPASSGDDDSWEMVVGTSWLNRIGVLVFVIGIALLVGYSFTRIEPAGRVAIGYALSASLLVAGVVLERRPGFRSYAYGLVGGGWAGIYFTTFAMHEVPEAKLIDDPLTAVLLLATVATGMVAHSLRYRSQVVTALAFVVAYVTLALSPLSGFALAASVPLAGALVIVSQRFGWTGLSVLGMVATYGSFVLRGATFPGGPMDAYSSLPYLTLAGYWLTFEAADLAGMRLRRRANADAASPRSVPAGSLLALNAVGVVGALLVILPADDPNLLPTCLFIAGAVHLVGAVVRARLAPELAAATNEDTPFDPQHLATALAAAFFAFGIGLGQSGTRESLAYLLEAQLLFVAGLTLGDSWIRRMASIVAIGATAHAAALCVPAIGHTGASTGFDTTTAVAALMAVVWYGNGEVLFRRAARLRWAEAAYAWIGTILLGLVIVAELAPAHQGLAGLALAWLLTEAGFRRGQGFGAQAHVVGGLGGYATVLAFATPASSEFFAAWGAAPASMDDWTALPASVLVAAAVSWRLARRTGGDDSSRSAAAMAWTAMAVVLLLLFEWRVVASAYLGPVWVATGLAMTATGLTRGQAGLRWLGYAVIALGTLNTADPVFRPGDPSSLALVQLCLVVVALYVLGPVVSRATRRARAGGEPRVLEDMVAECAALGATGLLVALILQEVRPSLITLTLGLQGLALMGAGLAARERMLRLLGLGLLLGCILKLFLYDLRELDALPRIFSFVVLGLILLGISWTYTRYRSAIRKLL